MLYFIYLGYYRMFVDDPGTDDDNDDDDDDDDDMFTWFPFFS